MFKSINKKQLFCNRCEISDADEEKYNLALYIFGRIMKTNIWIDKNE